MPAPSYCLITIQRRLADHLTFSISSPPQCRSRMTAYINGYRVPSVMSQDAALSLFPEGLCGLVRMETLEPVLPNASGGFTLEVGGSHFLPERAGRAPGLWGKIPPPFPEPRDVIEDVVAPSTLRWGFRHPRYSPKRRRSREDRSPIRGPRTEPFVPAQPAAATPWKEVMHVHPPESSKYGAATQTSEAVIRWRSILEGADDEHPEVEVPRSGSYVASSPNRRSPSRRSMTGTIRPYKERPAWNDSTDVVYNDLTLTPPPGSPSAHRHW
jgi:hypothetical protein